MPQGASVSSRGPTLFVGPNPPSGMLVPQATEGRKSGNQTEAGNSTAKPFGHVSFLSRFVRHFPSGSE